MIHRIEAVLFFPKNKLLAQCLIFKKYFAPSSFSWIQQLPSVRYHLALLLSSTLQATLGQT